MKYRSILWVIWLSVFLTACSAAEVEPPEQLEEIYLVAFDVLMAEDTALNSDMEFIAIDFSANDELTSQQKEKILMDLESAYNVETLEATREELEDAGRFDPNTKVLDGVVLQLEEVDFKRNGDVYFKGSKYSAGDGAIGMEGIVFYDEGIWKTKDVQMIWIS